MEDVARIAVIEQHLSDINKFNRVLHDLLQHINHILGNPHDLEVRTLKSVYLKEAMEHEAFSDYLKYIGFQLVKGEYIYPKEQTLSKLRLAQVAIQRKISICYGSKSQLLFSKPASTFALANKPKLKPVYVTKQNEFLQKVQMLFNDILKYENEEIQALAREHIPLVTLQLNAIERVREHQRQLKNGEETGNDLSYEIALLMELLGWFKNEFFSWVDKPDCEQCGAPTIHERNENMKIGTETCRVEIYKCTQCSGEVHFPRHNDVAMLLQTRRGRCGEWASCFTLFRRALGYDTRYVYDATDHVWCEIFDYDTNTWLHADPCEYLLDAPLTYSCGWKKKLTYVIAVSRDDLQDVTWRYTTNHKEVLKRRKLCEEYELLTTILALRSARQAQVSEARRRYLAKRCLKELVQLMVERKPEDYETRGRISGSKEWRKQRGEIGKENASYVFEFAQPGDYTVQYYTSSNKYQISRDGSDVESINSFENGTYSCESIFRKVEKDWRQVYLAREVDETSGSISWKMALKDDSLIFEQLSIQMTTALYETGNIECTVQFDEETPQQMKLGENWHFKREFKQMVLACRLSGGVGDVAWQHAQLFRQPIDSEKYVFQLATRVVQKCTDNSNN
ncbi:unnamed protein product [Parnassius apollo]|uniref:(apollo) hypothetical protein n=1 Tax=Parnassius apollo TaxID=110799 RepID=A0A8S3XBF5_PARAO|nr:unnamed protein product [Parnassius apollo]